MNTDTNSLDAIKEMLFSMVKPLVNFPDEVTLNVSETLYNDSECTKIEIKVAPEDVPLIIGKEGETIQAVSRLATNCARGLSYPKSLYVRVDVPRR